MAGVLAVSRGAVECPTSKWSAGRTWISGGALKYADGLSKRWEVRRLPGEVTMPNSDRTGVFCQANVQAAKGESLVEPTSAAAAGDLSAYEAATEIVAQDAAGLDEALGTTPAAARAPGNQPTTDGEVVFPAVAPGPAEPPNPQSVLDVASGMLDGGHNLAPHTEWATMLRDPIMPRFSADDDSLDAVLNSVVDFGAPAERGLWRDLSLARRMQGELRSSQAPFETLFASLPTAVLVASLGGGRPARFVHVNPALSRLIGHPSAALLGFGFADLEHPDQNLVNEHVASPPSLAPEEPYEGLNRWVHADGHDIWVRIRVTNMRAGNEQADQLLCLIEDVTTRRSADAVLRRSEELFRRAFVSAPRAALLIDLAGDRPGRVLAANRAACHLLGRSNFEMRWLSLESLCSAPDRSKMLDLLDRLASGDLLHYDGGYAYLAATGRQGRLVLRVQVVEGAFGQPGQALVHLRDDSSRSAAAGAPETVKLRVLLVEDEVVTQKLTELLLRKLGHRVDSVGNGLEALRAVSEARYDVVVMDLQMPVMDGLEATRRIRSELTAQGQPVIIAVTAAAPLGGRDACLTAGMDSYLAKPVREADLVGAMAMTGPQSR